MYRREKGKRTKSWDFQNKEIHIINRQEIKKFGKFIAHIENLIAVLTASKLKEIHIIQVGKPEVKEIYTSHSKSKSKSPLKKSKTVSKITQERGPKDLEIISGVYDNFWTQNYFFSGASLEIWQQNPVAAIQRRRKRWEWRYFV